ncbi:NADH dehydrogenase [Methylophaga thiooxydans]|uniref:Pyridine nucleotide-disulphide oxidoreductase, putative n=2 Tax=Methylophaga thiooxydans TaxID=392484 RepID=C0N5A0_9GAMM|nr:NAD(P)/FAD-dependent oxidoreductase [Methylophaga thiooxydans]EEF80018.1 Pyridine nucleotide-disulphide oxidoreductase, putative [Methylophaga thiooxydans DMS010]KGM07896.1 NADH dehydrogenase [Methylophaga thiooxydans]
MSNDIPKIVVVGGGAGGLELVTKLGKKLGKKGKAQVTLVDSTHTHIWKPLLHEVAAGTLDSHEDEIEYLSQANCSGFRFRLGRMDGLDRENKQISVAPTINQEGLEIIPRRKFDYDYLIISVGSISHDFGIKGVRDHCLFLDTTKQAETFQNKLLQAYLRAHTQGKPLDEGQLNIAIVGAGATGIELSAQLHEVSHLLTAYGLDEVKPQDVKISIIEAANRVLPGLPENLSAATEDELRKLGVDVMTNERVVEVTDAEIKTESGKTIPAAIKVWAAGIKAPEFLKDIDGLETNWMNQLVVRQTLQSTLDDNIYAIGDCCACKWQGHDENVPPRAQAAHQMASLVYKSIINRMNDKEVPEYEYHDYGSLVSLGRYSTVGNLMGNLSRGSMMIEGFMARLMYLSLYKMHQVALFGPFRVVMLSLSHLFRRSVHPKIKLH